MTNKLLIYEPEAATNLITNPRLADDVTGYADAGSTILRSLNRARWGRASLEIVTDGVGLQEGAYFRLDPQTQNTFYGGSVYVRGAGTIRARLHDASNGIEFTSPTISLDDNHWIRLEVLGRTGGAISNDLRLYVETVGSVQSVTYYTDGWMVEPNSHITTYFDGELEKDLDRHEGDAYFRWTGPRNGSSSTRSVRFRPAGRPRTIEFEDVGVYITQGSGLGMPPIRLNIQDLGGQSKSLVQNFQVQSRAIQLLFWARKEPQTRVCSPASLRELHILRERLEALIKPDRSHGAQPFLLEYVDGADSLQILAHYESGLEFDGDLRFPYFNSFAIRLLAVDPLWDADGQDIQQLTASKEVAGADYLVARINGEWQALNDGANGNVRAFAKDPVTGDIYAVGAFTSMDGVANTRGIARWDGTQWNEVSGGLDNGSVRAIAIGPGGIPTVRTVYVGGDFTSIDGVPAIRIAAYEIEADTWSEIGQDDGLDDTVRAIAIDRNGDLYIGGNFADSELGTITLNIVAFYDVSMDTFVPMGFGPGLEMSTGNGVVYAIEMDLDGLTPMIGGLFDREPGGAAGDLDRVATYDFDTNSFDEPGTDGTSADTVRGIALAPDGRFYIGGPFTNVGVVDARNVAVYTREDWLPLGQAGDGVVGVNKIVRTVKVDERGRAYFGGSFGALTDAEFAKRVGSWSGYSFSHLDIELPLPGNEVYGLMLDGRDIWLGFGVGGIAAQASFVQTVENRGKASVDVVLEVLGPARLLWLENQTTGDVIRMDLIVDPTETVVLDSREGKQEFVSDYKGNVGRGILADSDLADFGLIPGENKIAFFARDTDSNTEIVLRWSIRHWSFDDVVWAQSTG
ncbi:hypothetical protein LCGC14_1679990 [marine sediment metagenome]|uniref:Uncharacterized protein n=1 Tax=marine sediment metagenome TaxID=412755 RepID=A0A0F9K4R3_9ZZZZ